MLLLLALESLQVFLLTVQVNLEKASRLSVTQHLPMDLESLHRLAQVSLALCHLATMAMAWETARLEAPENLQ